MSVSQTQAYRCSPSNLCCSAVDRFAPCREEFEMPSLKTISEKLSAWRRYREAVRALSQLSDHELTDIGIRRGDIEFVARRSVASRTAA